MRYHINETYLKNALKHDKVRTSEGENVISKSEDEHILSCHIIFHNGPYVQDPKYMSDIKEFRMILSNIENTFENASRSIIDNYEICLRESEDLYKITDVSDIMKQVYDDYEKDAIERKAHENDYSYYKEHPRVEHIYVPDIFVIFKFMNEDKELFKQQFKKLFSQVNKYTDSCIFHEFSIKLDDVIISTVEETMNMERVYNIMFKKETAKLSKNEIVKFFYRQLTLPKELVKVALKYNSVLVYDKNDDKLDILDISEEPDYVKSRELSKRYHIIGLCMDSGINDNGEVYATFASIDYASCTNPKYGTKSLVSKVRFHCDFSDEDRFVSIPAKSTDGVANTIKLMNSANRFMQSQGECDTTWRDNVISNSTEKGMFPALAVINRYSPPGTFEGNWHIPSCDEMHRIFELMPQERIVDRIRTYSFYLSNYKKSFSWYASTDFMTSNISKQRKTYLSLYRIKSPKSETEDKTIYIGSNNMRLVPFITIIGH